jgi:hypothetical protein
VDAVYEFGCGTGYHLVALAQRFPDKKIKGLDWAEASRKSVNLLAEKYGLNLEGYVFDFYHPDEYLEIEENSAVITLAALEQVGDQYEKFLRFVLKKKPRLCINVECISELYDENNLIDYLAIRYHRKRRYLDRYLTRLQQLETQGLISIQKVKRTFLGDTCHEAYTILVWRPK